MADITLSEVITRLGAAFIPEKAAGIDATIQVKLSGAQPADFFLMIKDNQCNLSQGLAPSPRLTISADSSDLIKIFSGQMDGVQAFMQGKIRILGDMSLALKLLQLFKMR